MTFETAMVTDVISVTPGTSIEVALKILIEKKIRAMPVVDKNNKYLGMFDFHQVWGHLLPSFVKMDVGPEHFSFLKGSDDYVVERLDEIRDTNVEEVMNTKRPHLKPGTAYWEVLLQMYKHGSPLAVVDPSTKKLKGLISSQVVISDLERHMFSENK